MRQLKWLVGLVLIGTVIAIAAFTDARALLQAPLEWTFGLGWRGYVIFVALYVACIFFVPGSILTLGAGALFGPVIGSMLVSIAATLGTTAAFLGGRYLARDWVAQRIAGHATFRAIDRAVASILITRIARRALRQRIESSNVNHARSTGR